MIFTVNDKTKVNDFHKGFNDAFPFLKIDLFTHAFSEKKTISPVKRITDGNKTLCECGNIHPPGTITMTFSPDTTVAELKQIFKDLYNIKVQVFRQAGNSWLETTLTQNWTLEQQNKHGEILSKPKT